MAASRLNSFDAKPSECIDVGPFEEENSLYWNSPPPKSEFVNGVVVVPPHEEERSPILNKVTLISSDVDYSEE